MSRFRRKFILGTLAITGALLLIIFALLHTQPVESRILRAIQKQMPEGYELNATRMDINLLNLSGTLKKVKFNSPEISSEVEEVTVNAAAGLFKRKIELDEVRLVNGYIEVKPTKPKEKVKAKSEPLTLPAIHLGKALIQNVQVRYNDKEADLDLALDDIAFQYDAQKITSSLKSRAMKLGERQIPAMNVSMSGNTADFTHINNLLVHITGPQSFVKLSGDVGQGRAPALILDALLGRDLLPEQPGFKIKGTVDDNWVDLQLQGTLDMGDLSRELEVKSRFKYKESLLKVPIVFSLGDLASGTVDLAQNDAGMNGQFKFEGGQKLTELHPLLRDLEKALLTGSLDFPKEGKPVANARVRLEGIPNLDMHARFQEGILRFKGNGSPLHGGQVRFTGHTDFKQATLNLYGSIQHLDGIPELVNLPPDLCVGPINLQCTISSDMKRWWVDEAVIDLAKVAYKPWFEDHLAISLQGSPRDMQGLVVGKKLNEGEPILSFAIDLMEMQLHHASLSIDAPGLFLYDDLRYDLKLQGEGKGALESPVFSGALSAHIYNDNPIALFDSPFLFQKNKLELSDILLDFARGSLSGSTSVVLADPLAYDVDLTLKFTRDDRFAMLIPMDTFDGNLVIKGNQDSLEGKLLLPHQTLAVQDLEVPLQSSVNMTFDITPPGQEMQGSASQWRVAGIAFSDFNIGLHSQQLVAKTHFKIEDPEFLQKVAGSSWPEDLTLDNATGNLVLRSSDNFKNHQLQVNMSWADGSWCNAPFWVQNAHVLMEQFEDTQTISLEPFKAHFAGVDARVSGIKPEDVVWNGPKPISEDMVLGVAVNFNLSDADPLETFLELPLEIRIEALEGTLLAFTDLALENPQATFTGLSGEISYDGHTLGTEDLSGYFDDGLWLQGGNLLVDSLSIEVEPTVDGFELNFSPTPMDLDLWLPGFVGDAELEISIGWHNGSTLDDFAVDVILHQKGGTLVYLNPWLVFSNMHLTMSYDTEKGLVIHESGANVNSGIVQMSGSSFTGENGPDTTIALFVEGVELNMPDLRAGVSAALEWHVNHKENILRATTYVNHGYLTPNVTVKALVEDLLSAVPELHFPDPLLEGIQLEGYLATQQPFIVETDIAYLELEVPWLIIGGNLAEPRPIEGDVSINKGSSLDLRNQSFVFQNSQIQFLRNRPDDPYLLVTLVPTDDINKTNLNLTGFVSELGKNTDTQNLTTVLANYLVGQVFAMVSLESGQGKTLFDDSFSFVVTKSLTRKVVTRYSIPLNKSKSQQRVELSVGPFYNNFMNVASQNDVIRGDLQHARKFGYPGGVKPPTIRRIIWPDDTPRWVKRGFKLRKEHLYSETLWRRARLDLERQLKALGYMNPTLEHTWEKRVLTLNFSFGDRMSMTVTGLELSKIERENLFRTITSLDATGLRALEAQVERLALSKGYPSAAARARLMDDLIQIRVLVSQPIGSLAVDFGEAQSLLGPLYNSRSAHNAFITEYLISPDEARNRLRARLAAKGYLTPTIGPGDFTDFGLFHLPITPGPRAILSGVYEGNKPVRSPYEGRAFDYGLIETVAQDIQRQEGRDMLVQIRPRRDGQNVRFDLVRTALEESHIQSLSITGNNRIKEETIRRYVQFKEGMTQQDLIEAQQRLISAGPFTSARIIAGEDARMEVTERNRWDADYLISWDDEDDFGHAIQFSDHQLFRGFNSLGLRAEQSKTADDFYGRLKFDRIKGTRLDFTLGYKWRSQKVAPTDTFEDGEGSGYFVSTTNYPETWEPFIEFAYPLTKYQVVKLGSSHQRTKTRVVSRYVDEFFGTDETEEQFVTHISIPLHLSWGYKHLDYPSNPRNGILSTISIEGFLSTGEDAAFQGERYQGSLTTFKSWGRVMWSSRIETGVFYQNDSSEVIPDPETSPLFFMGGSTSVRGYAQDLLGPISLAFEGDPTGEDEMEPRILSVIQPTGGQAMFFTSQELTYMTPYYGLGITPFVDSGWVWKEYGDYFKTGLVTTGGLGLSLDTPVGYFRLDWATQLDEGPLKDLLNEETIEETLDLKLTRERIENSWYLRFGRVF